MRIRIMLFPIRIRITETAIVYVTGRRSIHNDFSIDNTGIIAGIDGIFKVGSIIVKFILYKYLGIVLPVFTIVECIRRSCKTAYNENCEK